MRVFYRIKLYFVDTGLLCYLLSIKSPNQLIDSPFLGSIFENMCMMETVKHLEYTLSSDQIFFYRDSVKQEVDLVIKTATAIHAYEFKLIKTPKETMLGGLRAFKAHYPSAKLHLVSLFEKGISTSDILSIHWSQLIIPKRPQKSDFRRRQSTAIRRSQVA